MICHLTKAFTLNTRCFVRVYKRIWDMYAHVETSMTPLALTLRITVEQGFTYISE